MVQAELDRHGFAKAIEETKLASFWARAPGRVSSNKNNIRARTPCRGDQRGFVGQVFFPSRRFVEELGIFPYLVFLNYSAKFVYQQMCKAKQILVFLLLL